MADMWLATNEKGEAQPEDQFAIRHGWCCVLQHRVPQTELNKLANC